MLLDWRNHSVRTLACHPRKTQAVKAHDHFVVTTDPLNRPRLLAHGYSLTILPKPIDSKQTIRSIVRQFS